MDTHVKVEECGLWERKTVQYNINLLNSCFSNGFAYIFIPPWGTLVPPILLWDKESRQISAWLQPQATAQRCNCSQWCWYPEQPIKEAVIFKWQFVTEWCRNQHHHVSYRGLELVKTQESRPAVMSSREDGDLIRCKMEQEVPPMILKFT